MKFISKTFRANYRIRAKEVMVIDTDGSKLGILPLKEALKIAEDKELDLVEVSPHSSPPVCKILDFGKFKYELSKREREAKQKRKSQDLKEVKFRLKIDDHDFQTKTKTAIRLLKSGNKVKAVIMFRGRERVYTGQGIRLMERLAREISEISIIERPPKLEGRNMVMILAPK